MRWRLVGGSVLLAYNAVVEIVAEYVGQRISDPGWIGRVLAFLADPPPWFMFLTIFVGLGLIHLHFRQSRVSGATSGPSGAENVSDTIPYVEIRQLANAEGWQLNDDSPPCVNRAYELEQAMRQAASGDLLVWGRRYETPLGSNPLLLIPKEHFIDGFTFHYGYLTRDNVENISTYTWKPEPEKTMNSFGGQNYCDLYVTKSGIKRLLRRSQLMSLQEAATVLYEVARESGHFWSYVDGLGSRGLIGDSPSDEVLNSTAQLIADKNVKIYGKHPPSRIREEITAKNGFFRNGATEFWVKRMPRTTAPAYVELEVRRSDLRPLIQEASARSL